MRRAADQHLYGLDDEHREQVFVVGLEVPHDAKIWLPASL